MVDKEVNKELDVYKYHRAIWGVVAGTGAVTVVCGYRDELLIGFSLVALLLGLYAHYKIRTGKVKKTLKKKTKGTTGLMMVVSVLTLVIAGFATADNVRIAVTVATIQHETEGFTTIQRCKKRGDDQVCMHESKKKGVVMYHLNRGDLVKVEDITETINKYNEKEGKTVGESRVQGEE